jgi:hypothetical protein
MRAHLGSFTADEYGQVVALVRKKTGDNRDYSTFYESDEARALWPHLFEEKVESKEGQPHGT